MLKLGTYNISVTYWKTIDTNFAIGDYNLGMTLRALNLFTKTIAAYEHLTMLKPIRI